MNVKQSSMIGPFCCILCQEVEENLITFFGDDVMSVDLFHAGVWRSNYHQRDIRAMIWEFVLHMISRERPFVVVSKLCCVEGHFEGREAIGFWRFG